MEGNFFCGTFAHRDESTIIKVAFKISKESINLYNHEPNIIIQILVPFSVRKEAKTFSHHCMCVKHYRLHAVTPQVVLASA